MKRFNSLTVIIALTFALLLNNGVVAQQFNDMDKNPHDIVYYKPSKEETPQIKVIYGRPKADGLSAFNKIVWAILMPRSSFCSSRFFY